MTLYPDRGCAAAQSKPGIRVLVAGTENILDNLYFGALQQSLPLQAPFWNFCQSTVITSVCVLNNFHTIALAASSLPLLYERVAAYFPSM